jgi:glutaconyl-CoA/methylmalonyl-CoA decarboxylase subunit gamma
MKMLRITLEGKTYEVGVEVLADATSTVNQTGHGPAVPLRPIVSPAITALSSPATAPATASVSAAEGCRIVASPMAGHVFKCLVKPGDVIAHNQVLMVLDAMKMETPIAAPFAGTVRAVLVKEGDSVEDGQALLHLEGQPQ